MKDSRVDTYEHIGNVQRIMAPVIAELTWRQLVHDASKLASPEVEVYDELEDELRAHDYDTEGYWATLRRMKPAIDHHYAFNRHHPEHHADGIHGMSLVDLLEMLCDWKAASMRRPTNIGLSESVEHNQKRFGYGDELKRILLNTASLLGEVADGW